MTASDRIRTAKNELRAAERALVEQLKTQTGRSRGVLTRDLWWVRKMGGAVPHYFSQFGQDWLIDSRLFRGKTGGVFADIGGYDGVKGSNTLFFELMRGWTGVLVEPVSDRLDEARARRRCPCLQVAVAGRAGTGTFLQIDAGLTQMSGLLESYDDTTLAKVRANPRHRESVIDVETVALADLLTGQGMARVDYLSLDVEGGERAILESFPFGDIDVSVWSIENADGDPEIAHIMRTAGYRLVEYLGVDEIYARNDLPTG